MKEVLTAHPTGYAGRRLGNYKTGLRISVNNIPILHKFQGNPLAQPVDGVDLHAPKMILEGLHKILFGYGFQKVDYPGNFVYLSDTSSKVLISAKVKIALDNHEIGFLLIWFTLGRLHLQAALAIKPL